MTSTGFDGWSVSPDSIQAILQDKQIAIVHPVTSLRPLFLSYFIDSTSSGLVYHRMTAEASSVMGWVGRLLDDIAGLNGAVGQQTRGLLQAQADPAAVAVSLARELGALNPDGVLLYLDDVDAVELGDGFAAFMRTLIGELPPHVRMVVSSRVLPRAPWQEFVKGGKAAALGLENRRDNLIFSPEVRPRPQLECTAFGQGQILVNGRPVVGWEGTLPRLLAFYLIDNPLVMRDEIFQDFWPDLSAREATNIFHVTKRKMNERLTYWMEGASHELTQYVSGFYMATDQIARHYDVADFVEAVELAMQARHPRRQMQCYQRAIGLYRAPFLQSVNNMPWVLARRQQLSGLYASALVGMGRLLLEMGEYDRALGYLARAAREVPEREDVHRDVIALYLHFGMMNEARMQYDLLRQELSGVSLLPSSDMHELLWQLHR